MEVGHLDSYTARSKNVKHFDNDRIVEVSAADIDNEDESAAKELKQIKQSEKLEVRDRRRSCASRTHTYRKHRTIASADFYVFLGLRTPTSSAINTTLSFTPSLPVPFKIATKSESYSVVNDSVSARADL